MGVVASPAQVRKQRVGDVDGARPSGPSGARKRVEAFKFGDRRHKLADRAQPTQSERLGAGHRTRERIEANGVWPPSACEFGVSDPEELRLRLEKRGKIETERAEAHAKRLEGPALVAAEEPDARVGGAA